MSQSLRTSNAGADQVDVTRAGWSGASESLRPTVWDVADVCRELQVTEATYYRWRNQFGGLKADDAKRLKDLERENSTLKRLLVDAELEKAALKEIAKGNF
jgi:transposase-like protein